MTQPLEAVGGEATPVEPTNPADVFTQLAAEEFGVTDEEEQPAETEGEEPTGEEAEDEPEIEEEADDLPPIDPPVSLSAEDKETFKSLPRPAQEILSKRIGEAEKGLHQKAQEARQAQQTAIQQANAELAQIEAAYAQQWQQYAESMAPERPDPALLATNPYEYAMQQRKYDDAVAQRQQAQQTAQTYAQQAQARAMQMEQATNAEQHRIIVEHFPEYADPTTGPELQRKLTAVAKELGYTDELISQARASDILAMRTAADWKAKAEKYDALQAKKMEKVRSAKGLPKVATPGVAVGNEQLRARNAQAAFEAAKSSKNRDVQGKAFFDYLQNSGQI